MADPQLQVMVQQDRADLVGFGKRVAAQNGLADRIRFANGPLVMAGDDATSGPRGLRHCLADFRPDMLRLACDAVDPGWMAALDWSMLSRILLVPAWGHCGCECRDRGRSRDRTGAGRLGRGADSCGLCRAGWRWQWRFGLAAARRLMAVARRQVAARGMAGPVPLA